MAMLRCGIKIPHHLRIKYNNSPIRTQAVSVDMELQAIENTKEESSLWSSPQGWKYFGLRVALDDVKHKEAEQLSWI